MSNGRIEIPLDEYNAMSEKIKEHEKVINSISHEASNFKEENEALRDLLTEIHGMNSFDRVTQWANIKRKIEGFLKHEE
jgi:hypothetical protein